MVAAPETTEPTGVRAERSANSSLTGNSKALHKVAAISIPQAARGDSGYVNGFRAVSYQWPSAHPVHTSALPDFRRACGRLPAAAHPLGFVAALK